MNIFPSSKKRFISSRAGVATLAATLVAAATAVWVESRARRAERDNPPAGKFLDIDGVRLHYVMRGEGPPIVLLHGNTVTHADFTASGVMDRLARNHRVIAFDRPGYGFSSRPRDRFWTPAAQAALFNTALERLDVKKPVVVGHSMGTLIALSMALDFPSNVSGLVLIGGYYYAGLRVDALMTTPVALPVVGDVMRYTVTALAARAMLKGLAKVLFSPNEVPPHFISALSREMMVRPVQLRGNAEDAAYMIPAALSNSRRYGELKLPVTLIAGAEDAIIDKTDHSARLHGELPQSKLHIVPGTGHMPHYTALDLVVAAIDEQAPAITSSVSTAPVSHLVKLESGDSHNLSTAGH